jgi:D-lactate dehydrogenase
LQGFGCRVLAYDMFPADDMKEMGVEYMELDEMLPQCDAVCIFCPLTESTHHLLNEDR